MSRLEIGQEVDRYEVIGILGAGGSATVYAVRHRRLGSIHALKVMNVSTAAFRRRLLDEGRGQAALRHPNIVSVFDVLDVDGAPALLMEYVSGPTLKAFLRRGDYTLAEALWLFRGVVLGVGAAHRRGLIHRDLKPDNVLLAPTNDGLIPKVTDFGLVKRSGSAGRVTRGGIAVGTAPYMAPEQIADASRVDHRVDLWSLGCMLYELVVGERPFDGRDVLEVFNRIRAGAPRPAQERVPDLPGPVVQALERLLVVDRERRMGSCDELFELLFDRAEVPVRVSLPAALAHAHPHEEEEAHDDDTTSPTDVFDAPAPGPVRLAPVVPLPGEDLPPGLAEASWSSTGERTLPPLPRPREIGLTPSRRVAVPALAALASAAAFALALGMLALAVLTVQRHVDPTAEAPPTLTEILPAYPLHGAPP